MESLTRRKKHKLFSIQAEKTKRKTVLRSSMEIKCVEVYKNESFEDCYQALVTPKTIAVFPESEALKLRNMLNRWLNRTSRNGGNLSEEKSKKNVNAESSPAKKRCKKETPSKAEEILP